MDMWAKRHCWWPVNRRAGGGSLDLALDRLVAPVVAGVPQLINDVVQGRSGLVDKAIEHGSVAGHRVSQSCSAAWCRR